MKDSKLIYYYDALCGWCYGFSAVMSKVEEEFAAELDFEVISGGLFLGNRAGYVNEVAPHIKAGAYKSVEARTGVKFGEVFLKDVFGAGKMILNSLYPSIALCIVKEQFPEQELKFARTLLKAVYYDGLNPVDIDGLATYAESFGFDKEAFKLKMEAIEYEVAARQEFEKFRNSPFSGMPALVLETKGQSIPLANGYTSFDDLKHRLKEQLASH